ncbi:MAG: PKD domain-containing protein [Thermoplasmata archaeon]|nr:PKD domain-containing protein [Thermoplasmata archaeon]
MSSRRSAGRRVGGLVVLLGVWLALSAALPGSPVLADAAAHAAPTVTPAAATMTLSAAGMTPAAISLTWTQETLLVFSQYTIAYSTTGATGPWQTAGTIGSATTTTFVDAGFAPSTNYWWMVTASGIGSESSNVLMVTQPSSAFLSYSLLSATDLQFTWTNNATYAGGLAFQSYVVLESVGGHVPSVAATLTSVGTRSTSISGLSPGSSYSFYLNTTDCYAGCGGTGPSLSLSESNSVTYGAPLPLSASVSTVRSSVDVGQPDTFSCTPSGGQSPYSFAWDFGNGTFVPGQLTVSQAFPSAGAVTITCQVTDNQSSAYMAATTIVVALDPTPTASANRTAADIGQSIAFNCSASGGFPPYAFTWSFGDGASDSTSEPTHVYAAAGQRLAICTVSDATSTTVTRSVVLTVSPTLHVVATSNSNAAAPGTSLTFTATPANGSGNYSTVTWTFGDGTSASGTTLRHLFSAAGNYTVEAMVADSNGGQATGTVLVDISPLAVVLGTSAPSSASPNQLLTYSATASGGAGGPYNYTWTFGDGTTGYGAQVTHKFAQTGTYHVTLQVSDRLGTTHLTTLGALTVSVPPPAAPLVTAPLLLGLAALIGLVAFAVGVVLRRRRSDQAYAALAGRVPVTGPARTVRGIKVCPVCGASNVPVRKTCEACGAPLRGSLIG